MDMCTFLAYAVKLELETEEAYLYLAALMEVRRNPDAAAFFREMAGFSRLHRDIAMRRAGFDGSTDIHGLIASWPDSNTEIPDMQDSGGTLDLDDIMSLVLTAERRGVAFYEEVARTAAEWDIRLQAEEFAAEERGHVLALERFFGIKPY